MTHETLDQIQLAQHKLIAKKLVHCISYLRSAAGLFSAQEPKDEPIRCDT
jgi:hypothetical protein